METAKFKVGDILVDKKTSTRYRIIFVSGTQVIVRKHMRMRMISFV